MARAFDRHDLVGYRKRSEIQSPRHYAAPIARWTCPTEGYGVQYQVRRGSYSVLVRLLGRPGPDDNGRSDRKYAGIYALINEADPDILLPKKSNHTVGARPITTWFKASWTIPTSTMVPISKRGTVDIPLRDSDV